MITKFRRQQSPLDRAALTLMALLLILTVALLAIGDRSKPYVREFNWQGQQIGAEDTALSLGFSRLMERQQIERHLLVAVGKNTLGPIKEVLPGKISWSGKKLFYTLDRPAPYGNSYRLSLQAGTAADLKGRSVGRTLQPFRGSFNSRPLRLAFISTAAAHRGQLMVGKFGDPPQAVSPVGLAVREFRWLPDDRGLIFAAVGPDASKGPQIYRWENGQTQMILDNSTYQNVKFDLTADGQTLVVQRVSRTNSQDFGIWVIDGARGGQGRRISQGGSFMVTPDGEAVVVAEGQGVAVKSLGDGSERPIDFLPKFGRVLGFARNGTAAAMEKYNDDYTRSLFWVTNQGQQKELIKIQGEFQGVQFTPNGKVLYAVVATATQGQQDPEPSVAAEQYSNKPFLVAIDLATAKTWPLLELQAQQGIAISLSPDGRALILDQTETGAPIAGQVRLTAADGQDIRSATLWLLPIPNTLGDRAQIKPESLSLEGFDPRWAP
jgi:hypothetical protein